MKNMKLKSNHLPGAAFTLIELLVVITIIGILAAMTLVGLNGVTKTKKLSQATAELHSLETAIEDYRTTYGVYPPGNGSNTFTAALYSPLYYELTGVSFANTNTYNTVAGQASVQNLTNLFNVNGFLNCTKGNGEDAVNSRNFLPQLSSKEVQKVTDNGWSGNMLVTSVGGPDAAYAPIQTAGANVFRYKQPDPTNNNPGSYDLWVNLSLGATNPSGAFNPAKLYLVCNWQKNYSGGSTMP